MQQSAGCCKEYTMFDLHSYDTYIVYLSGGKDSLACLLWLLDNGIPHEKIELSHCHIDGPDNRFMDWPVTPAYCQAIADYFGLPLYWTWKEGGIEGEIDRAASPTKPSYFTTPEGATESFGGHGPLGTRGLFPQVSPNLSVRWCSTIKIDTASGAIRNQDRFLDRRTLTLTGERALESTARAGYEVLEPDKSDNRQGKTKKRHVDRLRPVHGWTEGEVWARIAKHHINPHPGYWLGFSRISCVHCIFAQANQRASERLIDPHGFAKIAAKEAASGKTIHRQHSVTELADRGTPYQLDPDMIRLAMSEEYYVDQIYVEDWKLPQGAYGDSVGPS